jgi:hypothetical protein
MRGPLTLTLFLILTTNPNRPMNLYVLSLILGGVYDSLIFRTWVCGSLSLIIYTYGIIKPKIQFYAEQQVAIIRIQFLNQK